jgi:aspartyl-tRNA(Asn)/glutamyl-tRNA(Gln) amidotransferase subunit C
MSITCEELEKIAALAYLDTQHSPQLAQEINDILDWVERLRAVDTQHIAPLFHPLEVHQRLRADLVTEEDCLAQLKAIAPQFEDNYYLVPSVLDVDE